MACQISERSMTENMRCNVVHAKAISVKRDLISVKRDLISVKRDLISVKRDLFSVKRDLIRVKRDLQRCGQAEGAEEGEGQPQLLLRRHGQDGDNAEGVENRHARHHKRKLGRRYQPPATVFSLA